MEGVDDKRLLAHHQTTIDISHHVRMNGLTSTVEAPDRNRLLSLNVVPWRAILTLKAPRIFYRRRCCPFYASLSV